MTSRSRADNVGMLRESYNVHFQKEVKSLPCMGDLTLGEDFWESGSCQKFTRFVFF